MRTARMGIKHLTFLLSIYGLLVVSNANFCLKFFAKDFAECRDTCDGFGVENNIYGVFGCFGSKCCIPDIANRPNTTAAPSSTSSTMMTKPTTVSMPSVPLNEQCGVGRLPTSRILGGGMTKPCDWPWQVSIRSRVSDFGDIGPMNTFPWCSGVLISDQWVLTTGYCVILSISSGKNMENLLVTAGEYNTREADYSGRKINEQYLKVIDIKIHPEYYKTDINTITPVDIINTADKTANNFALLKLEAPATIGQCVQKVCTPKVESCWSKKSCKIAGWGNKNTDTIGETSLDLLEADITIYSPAVCETIYDISLNMTEEMKPLTTCARPTNPGVNVCLGDNGGMVVCKDENDKWTVEGLINRPTDEACKADNMFLISYTQPAMDWIHSTMGM